MDKVCHSPLEFLAGRAIRLGVTRLWYPRQGTAAKLFGPQRRDMDEHEAALDRWHGLACLR